MAARELFGATYVTLGIVDLNDRTRATCPHLWNGCDLWRWRCRLDRDGRRCPGILGTVVAERRTVRADNPGGDPARLQLSVLHPEVQAFLAAPLVSPAHVYGWICLVGNEGTAFTEDDEHLLKALSAQVGRIYENLAFSAAALKRAEELEHEILERKQAESAAASRARPGAAIPGHGRSHPAQAGHGRTDRACQSLCVLRPRMDRGRVAWARLDRDMPSRPDAGRTSEQVSTTCSAEIFPSSRTLFSPSRARNGSSSGATRLLRDDEGRVIGTFSSGADITERNQAVEALRTAEERMRFALEAAGVGIWDMDYTTGVLRWSETLEAQYGLQPGTFGGTFEAFVERIHPDDRASVLETVGKAMKSGADFSVLHRIDLARRHGAVAERRGPDPPRRARRTGARRRYFPGRHRAPRIGGTVSSGAEDGSHRTAGRWRGARLQQSPDRDSGVLRDVAHGSQSGRSASGGHCRRSQGGHACRRAHTPVAGIQPQADHRTDAARPERGGRRHAVDARTPHRGRRDGRAGPSAASRRSSSPIAGRSSRSS